MNSEWNSSCVVAVEVKGWLRFFLGVLFAIALSALVLAAYALGRSTEAASASREWREEALRRIETEEILRKQDVADVQKQLTDYWNATVNLVKEHDHE